MYRWTVLLQTWMPSLSSSPRRRSAPQRGLRVAISRISAAHAVGGRPDGRERRRQNTRKRSSQDSGETIAVDGSGNAYVAGFTESTDFPTTSAAFQPAFAGGTPGPGCGGACLGADAFVAKIADAPSRTPATVQSCITSTTTTTTSTTTTAPPTTTTSSTTTTLTTSTSTTSTSTSTSASTSTTTTR